MTDEQVQLESAQYRATAAEMGDAALEAMRRGDIGMARTAARQAAQWARVVLQLESGQTQTTQFDDGAPSPSTSDA